MTNIAKEKHLNYLYFITSVIVMPIKLLKAGIQSPLYTGL
jgi:hypothetical protein